MEEQAKKNYSLMFSRLWILLVLAVVGAGAAYLAYDRTFEAKYEATARLMITTSDTENRALSVFDSIRSSQMAVGDVSQIITSEAVLSRVEKDSGIYWPTIAQEVNINAIPNTRIMEISARAGTPELALKLMQSLERNLGEVLKDVDSNIQYKVLSSPHGDSAPVNGAYPYVVTVSAALGGAFLGCLLSLALGEKRSGRARRSRAHGYQAPVQGGSKPAQGYAGTTPSGPVPVQVHTAQVNTAQSAGVQVNTAQAGPNPTRGGNY